MQRHASVGATDRRAQRLQAAGGVVYRLGRAREARGSVGRTVAHKSRGHGQGRSGGPAGFNLAVERPGPHGVRPEHATVVTLDYCCRNHAHEPHTEPQLCLGGVAAIPVPAHPHPHVLPLACPPAVPVLTPGAVCHGVGAGAHAEAP